MDPKQIQGLQYIEKMGVQYTRIEAYMFYLEFSNYCDFYYMLQKED